MGESDQHNTKDKLASISMKEVIGYAVGDAGFNFYWIIIGSYLSYFYLHINKH